MAKILFVQDFLYENLGFEYISACLKKAGHKCDIVVMNEEKIDLMAIVNEVKPTLIAFSAVTGMHQWVVSTANMLKEKGLKIPIVVGGPYPTYYPDVINEHGVDIILQGEAEEAVVELVDNLIVNKDITKIPNVWVKKDGKIYKNPMRPLEKDLSKIPFPDRDLYYSKYIFLRDMPTKRFLATRGCPYSCSFCFNHVMRRETTGTFVRKRTPEDMVNEILEVKNKYGLKNVRFIDDIFTTNKRWVMEFLDLYKTRIGLPFTCLSTANELTEDVVIKLKEAGCDGVTFGIETANEKIRIGVLNKAVRNEQIVNAARLLKKYKIKFGTYNIIGIPGETLDDMIKTLQMNVKIGTNYPSCTILQPYAGMDITKYGIDNGYLDESFDTFNSNNNSSMWDKSPFKIPNQNEVININSFFYIGVKMPFIIPILKRLAKTKPRKLYHYLAMASFWHRSFTSYKVDFVRSIKLGLKMKSTMKRNT